MGLEIEDGKGRGISVGVNGDFRLLTTTVSRPFEEYINENGDLYHVLFDKDPDGNDDCIVYVKNESTMRMYIFGLMMYIGAACEVTWKLGVEGTPAGGTDVTPVSMNATSGKTADGTFQHGTDITGLSGGNDIHIYIFTAAKASAGYRPESTIILDKNDTFAVYVDTAGVRIAGHVGFGYHDISKLN